MSNIIIENSEIIFLRDSILKKYCAYLNEDYDIFSDNLTGTLKHYESIADIITDYLDEENEIINYTKLLVESPFKIVLRKWIEENEKMNKQRSRENEPSVSANIIRKLIFYGPKEERLSFKDYFVLACYIYIGVDRAVVLKKLKPVVIKIDKTIPPQPTSNQKNDKTIPPFEKSPGFVLIPLEDIGNKEKKLEFYYNNEEIILNRANLDPGNFTITSKVQAKINRENGEWKIGNESDLKTTYIQIIKPFTLEKGDVIVFGNKHYLFDDID